MLVHFETMIRNNYRFGRMCSSPEQGVYTEAFGGRLSETAKG